MFIQRNFEDDHNIFRRWTDYNASNVVVLICVITRQHVGVSVLHQGTSLPLGSTPYCLVAMGTPLGTALMVKESTTTLVVLWVSLGTTHPPTIMGFNCT